MKNILNKKIGIIGGGQLGKMMILEAKRMGLYVVTLDPAHDCPSHSISDEHIIADLRDEQAICELTEKVDVITYEIEHINAEALLKLEQKGHIIYPPALSLQIIQDKFTQKAKLRENGMKVPAFKSIKDLKEMQEFANQYGYPFMLKSRKGGYDGKGNYLIKSESDLEAGFTELKGDKMAEEFIDYSMEVSVVAVRAINGDKVVYPIPHNVHENSILATTTVPANLPDSLESAIKESAERVMDIFDGVGTFGVEMFVGTDNQIYINEVAPRPHNSGHFTIEGCRVNQFENHIRAILGLPLGDTSSLHNAVITRNLLGLSNGPAKMHGLEESYKHDSVNIHVYGKNESKTGRKMGHYTITAESLEVAKMIDVKISKIVKITGD